MMTSSGPLLVLGNQLFCPHPGLSSGKKRSVWMVEHYQIATQYRYHQLRLVHQFVAMRAYADQLRAQGHTVHYLALDEGSQSKSSSWVQDWLKAARFERGQSIQVARIPDRGFAQALAKQLHAQGLELEELPSPYFCLDPSQFDSHLKRSKKPFMKTFYEQVRRSQKILVDAQGNPIGGKFSFDSENRKKLPKSVTPPELPKVGRSCHEPEVRALVQKLFSDHPGDLSQTESLWLPYDRAGALLWWKEFLRVRFHGFGPYEDAIVEDQLVLFHSVLAPLMNLGLLTPHEVTADAYAYAKKHSVPIESLEGFVRQILGWREFVHGIYLHYDQEQQKRNHFDHHRLLAPSWWNGTTGLLPLDTAIQRVQRYAYTHHIERLMVIGNAMLLSEVSPQESYRWFMEMFLDSYEWVMGPNVFGMSQMSDGGIFATKPYISGSNYLLKMSHYPKGEWCETWDGLYWNFISRHLKDFEKNPRMSMMASLWKKMDPTLQARHQKRAKAFIQEHTREALHR